MPHDRQAGMPRSTSDGCFLHHTDSLVLYYALRSCNDSYISKHIHRALDALTDSIRLYGPGRVFSSYNGGKDADVVMHLLRAAYAKYSADTGVAHPAQLVYFCDPDEFEEVLTHIDKSERAYGLRITRYDQGIVQGLKEHLQRFAEGACAAFVLGTRKGDPNCHDQETFAPSSTWMPIPFMRVNPILQWEYGHVWHFLRTFALPYCPLYDLGYTSLGRRSQTFPNPALQRKALAPCDLTAAGAAAVGAAETFWPAYMLSEWGLERAGRVKTKELAESFLPAVCALPEQVPQPEPAAQGLTAALLIIGDEILSGFTSDSNLLMASRALASIGIPLKMVSVVSDDVDAIAAEALRLSQKHDVVISSGGIGPTHDDVTIKAVAQALGQDVAPCEALRQHLLAVRYLGDDATDEALDQLSRLPEHSRLRFPPSPPLPAVEEAASAAPPQAWPILQCDNIFVLPGVPQLFAEKVLLVAQHFLPRQPVREIRKIVLDLEETRLLGALNAAVQSAEAQGVKIGSYPFVGHPEFKTIVTVEGLSIQRVECTMELLLRTLPARAVLRVEKG